MHLSGKSVVMRVDGRLKRPITFNSYALRRPTESANNKSSPTRSTSDQLRQRVAAAKESTGVDATLRKPTASTDGCCNSAGLLHKFE
jgi:hypothetical protein